MSNTPKLRFKGFNGDWEENELNNIAEISKSRYNPLKDEQNYKCIELENLSQGTGLLLGYFNSKEQKSTKNKFNKGEVLFGKLRPYLKKYYLADFEGVCSSEIWVLNGISVSNNFLYRLVQTDKFNFISNVSSGSKMPRADWDYMCNFPFLIPSKEEQEKIASFFSLIDDKISLQGEKLEMLKDYKRGMMQKIFSRALRFKDDEGRDYPEWEEMKLGDICYIQGGYAFKSSDFEETGVPIIRISNMDYNVSLDKSKTVYTNTIKVDSKFEIKQNSILIAMSGSTGKIGLYTHKEKAYLNQRVGMFVNKDDYNLNYSFLHHLMRSREYESQILKIATSGVQSNISPQDIENLKFKFPSLSEQYKIATILSTIDSKIELEEQRLEHLKEMKKGLLQQMFV